MKTIRLFALLALSACSLGTAPDVPEGALKVLFIGNSLTYFNDLPRTVAQLASSAGAQQCYCYPIAYPDFALEDHYDFRQAVTALEEEDWDFVVMQQGPSALAASKVDLPGSGTRRFRSTVLMGFTRPKWAPTWRRWLSSSGFTAGRRKVCRPLHWWMGAYSHGTLRSFSCSRLPPRMPTKRKMRDRQRPLSAGCVRDKLGRNAITERGWRQDP